MRAAWLALLLAPAVQSQQKVNEEDVAYMQHDEFVKAVSTDDKSTVEALLSTEAGQKSVHLADREEGLTALVKPGQSPYRHRPADSEIAALCRCHAACRRSQWCSGKRQVAH